MSGNKYFETVAWIVTALTLAVTILFMNGGKIGIEAMAHTMGYENRLFDNTKVHTVDIIMENWNEFIANAASEEYYAANVVIDGEPYQNVGIRAKGNTSLSTVASLDSERYSFKIEFDQYDSAKSYHGLDKLSLNNLIQDSTMMKDYLSYTMMNQFGVNSSLCSFTYITVNGEDWGLYLAVEGVEETFLERNYGSDYGKLYKPDSMSFGGGRGNGMDFDMKDFDLNLSSNSADSPKPSKEPGGFNPSSMFGGGASDVKLQYIDDQPGSYSNIWNNSKTNITEADQRRLIESLKKLSNGKEIASVVNIEQVIRYFVVHNYICNDDSYTGMMVHNYYLYEKDGQLAMIPWDYNLGFGTFGGKDATSTVNTPIDAPVSGGSSDRPMLNWIFENEEYTELYHQYFSEFTATVDIAGIIDNAYNLIKSYVEKDPTAFYSFQEFELGVETLRQFCQLRSESISMQLENGKTASDMNYADASAITLSDMGSMEGGAGGFGGDMPKNMPEGFDPSNIPDGFSGNFPEQPSGSQMKSALSDNSAPARNANANRPSGGNMQKPGGDFPLSVNQMGTSPSNAAGWIWMAVSAVILGIGLIVAKRYKS